MSIHRFQSDPAAPTFCTCGYHRRHRCHATLDQDALPDLYEALKLCISVLREGLPANCVAVAVERSEAAIAKAEGKS
jgi:hypothetical protein